MVHKGVFINSRQEHTSMLFVYIDHVQNQKVKFQIL